MNMAYSNKFVVTIIQNDHIKQEIGNTVPIEFGEYKIRLRNKNPRRAVCNLSIDGENVSGGGFVIPANSFIDIERPLDVDRKFKFVPADSEAAYDFGKNNNSKNGEVVATFSLERLEAPIIIREYPKPRYPYTRSPGYWPPYAPPVIWATAPIDYPLQAKSVLNNPMRNTMVGSMTGAIQNTQSLNQLQTGTTVEGDKSNQKFSYCSMHVDAAFTTIKIFLKGYSPQENIKVKEPSISTPESDDIIDGLEREAKRLKILLLQKEIEELQKALQSSVPNS